jgi:uncharacterized protein (DUF486 family)
MPGPKTNPRPQKRVPSDPKFVFFKLHGVVCKNGTSGACVCPACRHPLFLFSLCSGTPLGTWRGHLQSTNMANFALVIVRRLYFFDQFGWHIQPFKFYLYLEHAPIGHQALPCDPQFKEMLDKGILSCIHIYIYMYTDTKIIYQPMSLYCIKSQLRLHNMTDIPCCMQMCPSALLLQLLLRTWAHVRVPTSRKFC